MSYVTSPNMSLTIPTVGNEAGPDYALDINASLVLVDAHDHTAGKGAPITSGSLNINADLSFNNHSALSVKGIQLTAQTTVPSVGTIYESGNDLYFVDAIGNNIRMTISGAVAGTPGSITNLVAPASATYIAGSSVFVWQSNVNKAADMDFGSAIMRNISPNSTFSMTLAPPAAMASSTTITLPVIPAAESFMTMDNSGQIIVSIPRASGINTINIAPSAITTSKIADLNVTTAKLADGSVTAAKLAAGVNKNLQSQTFYASGSFTVPAGVTGLYISGCAGGMGGQGSGDDGASFTQGVGGIASMYASRSLPEAVTPGAVITVTVGLGGAGGLGKYPYPGGASILQQPGQPGGSSTVGSVTFASIFRTTDIFNNPNGYGSSSALGIGGNPAPYNLPNPSTGGVGSAPGAGGGGGNMYGNGYGGTGGAGGSGIIIITWVG